MSRSWFRVVLSMIIAAPLSAAPMAVGPSRANHDGDPTHATFQKGDVFVAIGDGKVEWRFPDGTLNRVLDTGASGFTTGMAFDAGGHLYVTNFNSNAVYEFDTAGNLVGPFGSGFNCDPESIVFDSAGDAYIGQADCSGDVLKFNAAGGLRDTYDVPIDDRGSDWIDLAADQCTLRYTSEGSRLLQYDVCTHQPLPDLATQLNIAYALRILPDDRTMVANNVDIRLLSTTGATERTYDATGQNCWFALTLDPDAETFWSADLCSGKVYRFNIATGAEVSSFQPGGSNTAGLAVYGELRVGTIRECDTEDLSGAFGELPPAAGGRVTVRYDGRFLVDETLDVGVADARAIAEQVQQRAEFALTQYGGPLGGPSNGLGFTVPEAVTVEITCQPFFIVRSGLNPIKVDRDAFVEGADKVKIKLDFIRNELAAAALADFPPGDAWNAVGAGWKNLVDHEIFHTVQYETSNVWGDVALGHQLLVEAPAVVAQDLMAETDDDVEADQSRSYLDFVQQFHEEAPKPPLDIVSTDNAPAYQAAGVMQYFGERFGDQGQANLELRVADYLRRLIGRAGIGQMDAVKDTIGRDALVPVRDYLVAAYGLRLANVSATENASFALLDAETSHGQPAGQATGPIADYPSLTANTEIDLSSAATDEELITLGSFQSELFEIALPPDTQDVRIVIERQGVFVPFFESRMAALFAPIGDDNRIVLDAELMPEGTDRIDKTISVNGRSTLLLSLAGRTVVSDTTTSYVITATRTTGLRDIDVLYPTAAGDHTIPSPTAEPIELEIVPTIDGSLAEGLGRASFRVLIDDTFEVPANAVVRENGSYRVTAWAPGGLGAGTYGLTLLWNGEQFSVPGDLIVEANSPLPRYPVAAAAFGELGQGQSATATAFVSPGSSMAEFAATWSGSDFDLTLTAPSGRIIPETSTDPDVSVSQTPTSVRIVVTDPEPGEWQLGVVGVDVPGGSEPVDYEVSEAGSPFYSRLFVGDGGSAGLPLDVAFALTQSAGGIAEATVRATVTDPAGVARTWNLSDDGTHGDTGSADGIYGGELWATEQAGSYLLEVNASGLAADGSIIQRYAQAEVTLAPKLDTDGDGVADAAEARFGIDPNNPSDAAVDHDADGLDLPSELAMGTEPFNPDTDARGEHDGSESAAARDPRLAGDDVAFPGILLSAVATDGNHVEIVARADGPVSGLRLVRLAPDGSRAVLGTFPGTSLTLSDGPLATGTYHYAAFGVGTDAAESVPTVFGPLEVAADVTPPSFSVHLNGGRWKTTSPEVSVTFTDLDEPATEMRLALSPSALETAAWVPFASFTTISLPSAPGSYSVYAQLRDAAGNESRVASGFVLLVDETSPDMVPPTSIAGPLPATTTAPTIDVPVIASDDLPGPLGIELWARHRPNPIRPWSSWELSASGSTDDGSLSLPFTFGSDDGEYEFYSIAIDAAENREAAPAAADAVTVRDAVDDPPDILFGSVTAVREIPPAPARATVRLTATGDAADDRSAVSVRWRLFGIRSDGTSKRLTNYGLATPDDGAFDEWTESFRLTDTRNDAGYVAYDLEVQTTAGGHMTTTVLRVAITSGCGSQSLVPC